MEGIRLVFVRFRMGGLECCNGSLKRESDAINQKLSSRSPLLSKFIRHAHLLTRDRPFAHSRARIQQHAVSVSFPCGVLLSTAMAAWLVKSQCLGVSP